MGRTRPGARARCWGSTSSLSFLESSAAAGVRTSTASLPAAAAPARYRRRTAAFGPVRWAPTSMWCWPPMTARRRRRPTARAFRPAPPSATSAARGLW